MSLGGSDRDRFDANLSPSALADLSRLLTLQSYLPKDGGLFGSGWAQFMADRSAASLPVSTPAVPQLGVQRAQLSAHAVGADPGPNSSYQVAALSSPSTWPIPVPGCANCHGPSQPPVTPSTAPPRPPFVDDPWTYYPEISRRNGGGWGTSTSGDDHKQCEIQERRDNAICKRQVSPDPKETPEVRAICQASRMDRYAHCLDTKGEIGFPQLMTYKAQKGEPPIQRWRKP